MTHPIGNTLGRHETKSDKDNSILKKSKVFAWHYLTNNSQSFLKKNDLLFTQKTENHAKQNKVFCHIVC